MIKFTKHTLKKLETIFKEAEYQVRYGKGNFQAGYCLLDNKKQVVVNKYFTIESRISSLIDILKIVRLDETKLSQASLEFFKKIRGKELKAQQ